jgi:hypothetical protein
MFFCFNIANSQAISYFPITHHITVKDDGTGIEYAEMIPLIMEYLNEAFLPAGIQFYMSCTGINIIRGDTLFDITHLIFFN